MSPIFHKLHTMVSYNRQLRVKLAFVYGLAQALAIPSGFGRRRIRRNGGYTLLCAGFYSSKISEFLIFRLNSGFTLFKISIIVLSNHFPTNGLK